MRLPLILSQSWEGSNGKQYTWLSVEGQRERWFMDGKEVKLPPALENYGWYDVEPPIGMPEVVWPCTERYQPVPVGVAMSPSTARDAVDRAITDEGQWRLRDVFRTKQKDAQVRQGETEMAEDAVVLVRQRLARLLRVR